MEPSSYETSPAIEAEELKRSRELLQVLVPACIVGATLTGLSNLLAGNVLAGEILLGGALGAFVALVLVIRGRARAAGVLLVWVMLAVVHLQLVTGRGVHDTALLLYPLIMVVAAALLKRSLLAGTALLCVASAAVVVHGEMSGWLQLRYSELTTLQDLLDVTVVVLITGLAMRVVIQGLRGSAREALSQREALREANEVLEARARELRGSEARWRSLIETAPDRIISVDCQGGIRFVSDESGDPDRALVGKPVGALAAPESSQRLEEAVREAFESGQASRLEVPGWNREGQPAWYAVRVGPVKHEGKVESVTLIATDVWVRKQVEAEREALIRELEARNEELQRFNYSVSHDLKAPLITIRGFLGFVRESAREGDVERLGEDLERVDKAAGRMQHLLDDLLDLSRVGRIANPVEDVPFDAIAREAAAAVHERLRSRSVELEIEADLPVVRVDRQRLVQVVQNLLDNGAKFMGDQAQPRIRIASRGIEQGQALIQVEDNGLGVDPRHHERVFGLFEKLTARGEGTGVGLALVQRIVEVHGGRVWLESGGKGCGTTVVFSLPLATPGEGAE